MVAIVSNLPSALVKDMDVGEFITSKVQNNHQKVLCHEQLQSLNIE